MNTVLGGRSRAGSASRHHGARRRNRVAIFQNGDVLKDLSAPAAPLDFDLASSNHSAMPTMDHDEVSFGDAVDAHDPAYKHQNKATEGMAEDKLCCGSEACWKPSSIARVFDDLLVVAEWDFETTRVCKLAFPFVVQALLTGACEITRVAIIGTYIGTRELSAYLVVSILLSLTASVSSGLQDSLATLCTAAIEDENKKLAGQYVQLSIVFSILFSGVNIAFWMFFAGDALEWFGFDEETTSIGQDFATLLVFRDLIRGVALNIHSFLYVIGLDVYSTVVTTLEEVVTTVAVVLAILIWGSTLETVGIIYIISAYSILILNLVIIKGEGWFHEFRDGLVRPSALLVSTVYCNLLPVSLPSHGRYLIASELRSYAQAVRDCIQALLCVLPRKQRMGDSDFICQVSEFPCTFHRLLLGRILIVVVSRMRTHVQLPRTSRGCRVGNSWHGMECSRGSYRSPRRFSGSAVHLSTWHWRTASSKVVLLQIHIHRIRLFYRCHFLYFDSW
jgi:hypothetical protein